MNKCKILIVGGTCSSDITKIKESAFASHLANAFALHDVTLINGTTINDLHLLVEMKIPTTQVLFWIPDIDNTEDKILPSLKQTNPKMLLISSKRTDGRDITPNDLVGRMLGYKINLMLAIDKQGSDVRTSILDPLGNIFYKGNDLQELMISLIERVYYLSNASRKSTNKDHTRLPHPYANEEFINIVKDYGVRFSKFVDQINPNRLLGNASTRTRCSFGFPSSRNNSDTFFVSRRNVDKETFSLNDMVEVYTNNNNQVCYFGDNKPSVDTPIQLELYKKLPRVNYIIHGHCYIEGAMITRDAVPCGDLREVNSIITLINKSELHKWNDGIKINLRGHGCIILAYNLNFFNDIKLIPRDFPENCKHI